jgi:hypothetical protein
MGIGVRVCCGIGVEIFNTQYSMLKFASLLLKADDGVRRKRMGIGD